MEKRLCLPDESSIAQEIMSYLAEHPESQDTLDGIVQWWLLDRKIKYQEKGVKKALSVLVEQGYILERQPENRPERKRGKSQTVYCLNKTKKEVHELVKKYLRERKS